MAKVYVVTAPERIRGIYASWPECQAAVKGVSGARYQAVASREQAEAMLRGEGRELSAGLYGFVDGNHLGGVGVVLIDRRDGEEPVVVDEVGMTVVQVFLTGVPGLNQPNHVTPSEELRLNMEIPPCQPGSCNKYSRLGVIGGDVAGFPNGRRLSDDVLDASLQVVYGELIGNPNDLGDGVDSNDVPFLKTFPYVAYPHAGSDSNP